jgi:heat shock protein HslJ/uncharacterized protein YraI
LVSKNNDRIEGQKMTEDQNQPEVSEQQTSSDGSSNKGIAIAVLVSLVVIIGLLAFLLFGMNDSGDGTDSGEGGEGGVGQPGVIVPTAQPGSPSFTVVAPDGANIRVGPGTDYASVGVLAVGTSGQVTGTSVDSKWIVILAPQAPKSQGWVAAGLVTVENMDSVPIVPPPGEVATVTPVPNEPIILFSADETTIAAGECTSLRWKVENVSEVYVYPAGEKWDEYPVAGQGSQEVCPETSTVYEMRVILNDGNTVLRELTVEVVGGEEDPLARTGWQLASFAGNQVPLPETTITLSFDAAGNVNGNAGCNDYNTVYTVSRDQLAFGPISSTQKLCDEAIDAQEALYIFALTETVSYMLDGNQLILYDANGIELLRYNRIG